MILFLICYTWSDNTFGCVKFGILTGSEKAKVPKMGLGGKQAKMHGISTDFIHSLVIDLYYPVLPD